MSWGHLHCNRFAWAFRPFLLPSCPDEFAENMLSAPLTAPLMNSDRVLSLPRALFKKKSLLIHCWFNLCTAERWSLPFCRECKIPASFLGLPPSDYDHSFPPLPQYFLIPSCAVSTLPSAALMTWQWGASGRGDVFWTMMKPCVCIPLPCCATLMLPASCRCITACLQSLAVVSFSLDACILSAVQLTALYPLIFSVIITIASFLFSERNPFFSSWHCYSLVGSSYHLSKKVSFQKLVLFIHCSVVSTIYS